ncbi:MAG: TolC family protein [Candidatus Hydrogenedentes bacterium]|nr:TolC family protein [Candidatus Hydrogenedentota bacterium]
MVNRPLLLLMVCAAALAAAPACLAAPLSLAEAQVRVLEAHPALEAENFEIEAAVALAALARLRPNPVLSLEVEDLRWSGVDSRGTASNLGVGLEGLNAGIARERGDDGGSGPDDAEWTLSLEQPVELGGKRGKRGALAEREADVARARLEVTRFNLLSEAALAFVEVLGAQEECALLDAARARLQPLHEAVDAGVQAGKYPPVDSLQSLQIVEQLGLARRDAETRLRVARQALAGMWGAASADFDSVDGALPAAPGFPKDLAWQEAAKLHPLYREWDAVLAASEAEYALARAERLPDIAVTLGYRTRGGADASSRGWSAGTDGVGWTGSDESGDREHSVLLGVSVPLPLFNRNRGSIAAAQYRMQSASARQQAALRELERRMNVLAVEIEGEIGALTEASGRLLPRLREIEASTLAGYNQGRFNAFDYMQVLEDELELEQALLARRTRLYQAVVELERLSGRPLAAVSEAAAK